MFIGRESELELLEKRYSENQFNLFIVYGRRRVGKTTLLKKFSENKPSIFFVGEENNDRLSLERFSATILDYYKLSTMIDSFGDWEKAFTFVAEKAMDQKLVLILDEFPFLARSNPSLPSLLQNLIDHQLKNTKLFLIICGSSMSFMEKEVLSYKSPLYGRRTGSLLVEPFGFDDSEKFFPEYSKEDRFRAYSILGGVPQYLEAFNSSVPLAENIKENILRKGSLLYNEPRFLTMQEFRNPSIYNSIIETVADGYTRLNEIASKIGEKPDKTSKYMTSLLDLKIIEKIYPVGHTKRSRKSIYRLKDHFFRFYYRFITKHFSLLEQGMIDHVYHRLISPCLSAFFGLSYEEVCREYLIRENTLMRLPFVFNEIGSWWGNNPIKKQEEEIDILAVNEKQCIVGECKWRNKKTGTDVFKRLVEKSQLLPYEKTYYYLFSKSGFEEKLIKEASDNEGLTLVEFQEL
ncbi:MAG: ATP-binding protein [Thermotogota bacterium]|nr:ATP-binding protein [Thermotogota bacterium]